MSPVAELKIRVSRTVGPSCWKNFRPGELAGFYPTLLAVDLLATHFARIFLVPKILDAGSPPFDSQRIWTVRLTNQADQNFVLDEIRAGCDLLPLNSARGI